MSKITKDAIEKFFDIVGKPVALVNEEEVNEFAEFVYTYAGSGLIRRIKVEIERRAKESEKHLKDAIAGQFYGGIYGTCQNLCGFLSRLEKEIELTVFEKEED